MHRLICAFVVCIWQNRFSHDVAHKVYIKTTECCKMDGWVRGLRPFNSISVISRRWKGEHERLCAMKRHLGSGRISPPAGSNPRPRDPKSGALTAPPRGCFYVAKCDWLCRRNQLIIYTMIFHTSLLIPTNIVKGKNVHTRLRQNFQKLPQ